jgi:quercetin dioxygenase-like cupin family protein
MPAFFQQGAGTMQSRLTSMLALCWLALYGTVASAQSAVPIEQEPAHRLVLQNEHVRVFSIALPAGADTLWHVHRHDGISVRLADATIVDEPQDGPAKTFDLRRGAVNFGATPIAFMHRVRNVGATSFDNIYIELLAGRHPTTHGSASRASGQRPAEFENDRVRVLRRVLASAESTDVHTHIANAVAVPVTSGRLEISGPDGTTRTVDVKAGAAQWVEAGTVHALKNVGDAPMELVDLELD